MRSLKRTVFSMLCMGLFTLWAFTGPVRVHAQPSAKDSIVVGQLRATWDTVMNSARVSSDSCFKVSKSLLSEAQKCGHALGIFEGYHGMGIGFTDFGMLDSGMHYFELALAFADGHNLAKKKGFIYSSVAQNYRERGDLENALLYFNKAIENAPTESTRVTATMGKSVVYGDLSDYPAMKACLLPFLNDSLDIPNQVNLCNNLGDLYLRLNKLDSAKYFFTSSLQLSLQHNRLTNITDGYNNLAILAYYEDSLQKSLSLFEKALHARQELKLPYAVIESYNNLGEISYEMGNLALAKDYMKKGLALALKIGSKLNIRDCCYKLARWEYASGNYQAAFDYQIQYIKMDSTVTGEKTLKAVAELEKKHQVSILKKENDLLEQSAKIQELELEKKEKSIERLYYWIAIALGAMALIVAYFVSKRIQLRYRVNLFQQQSLQAQINPHFMFNVLNSIQTQMMEGNTDQASQILVDFSRLLRKNLDAFSETLISLEQEIDLVSLYLKLEQIRFKERLTFSIDCHPEIDTLKVAILPLVLQPMVENAILHGLSPKEEGGHVAVSIELKNNWLEMTIQDNGVGYTPGNKKSSKGLGLTEKRIKLWNRQNSFSIQNLKAIGKEGTLVRIKVAKDDLL